MSLQELQNLLKYRDTAFVNIRDGKNIVANNINYQSLADYNNDISVYLSKYKELHSKLQIVPRLKNGTSSRAHGKPFTVILRPDSNTDSTSQTAVVTQVEKNDKMDVNGFMGLNAPQILDAFSAQRENALLKEQLRTINQELSSTKGERDSLRNENYDLKRKTDLYEHDKENAKPSAFDKLIEGVAANPNALTSILGMLGNRPGALNAAATAPAPAQNNLTGNKALLLKYAEEHPEQFCALYTEVINKLNTDEEFATTIKNLLNPIK